jgi:hypothetical protein
MTPAESRCFFHDSCSPQRLRREFEHLVQTLALGLEVNHRLIDQDQLEYHRDLATRFADMRQQLRPLCALGDDELVVDAELQRLRAPQQDGDVAFLDVI